MNKKFQIFSIIIVSSVIFSCTSSEKLTKKGWQLYQSGSYSKADSKFEKALKKTQLLKALEGKAFVRYKLKDYNSAEKYIEKVYDKSKSSSVIYNYACFSNMNGNSSKAMYLLYELGNNNDFEKYRKLALSDNDFNSLRGNVKFQRYLSGYRRLKISPYELYSNDEDGIGILSHNQNELFVTISNNNYLILSTNIIQDKDHVFLNDYVVFDYPLGSIVEINMIDEDIYFHDILIKVKGKLLEVGEMKISGNGFMKIKIEDTESQPFSSGYYIPKERSLLPDLLLLVGAKMGLARIDNLDKSFVTKLFSCAAQYKVGTMNLSPPQAAIIAETIRRIIEKKGNLTNIGTTTFTNYLTSDLRSNNHEQLANLVDAGLVYNCIFGK